MANLYYGLIPDTTPSVLIVNTYTQALLDPGIDGAYLRYFHVNFKNRNGYNYMSSAIAANIASGERKRIELILPSSVVSDFDLDIQEIIISISSDGQGSNSQILRTLTLEDLPYVEIFFDSATLANTANNSFVSDIKGVRGCLRTLDNLDANELTVSEYPADGSLGNETKFSIYKDSSSSDFIPIPAGSVLTLSTFLDTVNADAILSRKLEYKLIGIYDATTGTIETTTELHAGIWYTWSAIDPLVTLTNQVPNGKAIYLSVRPKFRIEEIPELGKNSFVQFVPRIASGVGEFSLLAKAFGSCILPVAGRLRFFPRPNAFVGYTDGYAIILDRVTPYIQSKNIPIITNSVDKYGWVDVNAQIGIAQTMVGVPTSALPRAIIRTTSGVCKINSWSNFINTPGNSSIVISGTVTDSIRADYPDETLLNISSVDVGTIFNATHINYYVQENTASGLIYRYRYPIGLTNVSGIVARNQTILLKSEAIQTITISGLPNNNDIGFFYPSINNVSIVNLGTVSGTTFNGLVRVASALEWDGSTASFISHENRFDVLDDLGQPISEYSKDAGYWNRPSKDLSLDNRTAYKNLLPTSIIYDEKTGSFYKWVLGVPSTSVGVIIPTEPSVVQGYYKLITLTTSEENIIVTTNRVNFSAGTLASVLDTIDTLLTLSTPADIFTTINQLRASTKIGAGKTAYILRNNISHYYLFNASSTEIDNGNGIVKPNSLNTLQAGRWVKINKPLFGLSFVGI